MIRINLIAILLFVSVCSFSQIDSTLHVERQKRDYNMTQFDKDTFEKNKIRDEYKFETEDEFIRQFSFKDMYVEERENKLKNFTKKTAYWEKNLYPRQILYMIGGCEVGKIRKYNQQGVLIEEIDADQYFKYSMYNVADYILREDSVDIFKRESRDTPAYKKLDLSRNYRVTYPYYQIRFWDKNDNLIYYRIDGTTGKVLYKSINDDILIDKGDPNQAEFDAQKKAEASKKKKGFLGW